MKKSILLGLLVASFTVNASVLDKLKNTPASQYELGKVQLEIAAYLLTEKFKGEKLNNSKFKTAEISIDDSDSHLTVKVSLVGRSKYLTDNACQSIHEGSKRLFPKQEVMSDLWPSLSQSEYSELSSHFFVKTELISEDNPNLKITCQ